MRKFRKKIYNLFVPEFFGLIFKFIIIFKNYFLWIQYTNLTWLRVYLFNRKIKN